MRSISEFGETIECRKCKIKRLKKPCGRDSNNNRIFRDELGKLWAGKLCNNCKNRRNIDHARLFYGQKSRDDKNHKPYFKKGRESEYTAKKYFEKIGYKVDICDVFGPDLFIYKNGNKLSVEVKSVRIEKNSMSHRVNAVYKTRRNDDLICYVLGQKIVVLTMSEHLKNCSKTVGRVVTDFFLSKELKWKHNKTRP